MPNINQLSGIISPIETSSEPMNGGLSNTEHHLSGEVSINPGEMTGLLSNNHASLKGSLNVTQTMSGTIFKTRSSSGTDDYRQLINLPQINNITVIGNKTGKDYKLLDEIDFITSNDIMQIMSM